MSSSYDISKKQTVNLFSLFVIGTLTILIRYQMGISLFDFSSVYGLSSFLLVFLSYEIVLVSLIAYYITTLKIGIASVLRRYSEKIPNMVIYLVAISYYLITFIGATWTVRISNLLLVFLALIAIPQTNEDMIGLLSKIGINRSEIKQTTKKKKQQK